MLVKRFLLVSTFFTTCAFAHTHKTVNISGTDMQLRSYGHAFSGSIGKLMVQGFKKKGTFESELSIIQNDEKTISHFKKGASSLEGELKLETKNHTSPKTVQFLGLDRDKNTFNFLFGKELYQVEVKADKFEGGHFFSPEYSLTHKDKKVSFKLEGGEACYGYSAHLIAMIFSTYIFSH